MVKSLDEKDQKTLRRLGIRKTIKLGRITRKIYNKICDSCKQKVFNNPKTHYSEYCNSCQEKIQPQIKQIEGLTK